MEVSMNRGPPNQPPKTMILVIETSRKGPQFLETPKALNIQSASKMRS